MLRLVFIIQLGETGCDVTSEGGAKHLPPQRMNVISQPVTMKAMYSSFTWDRLNVMLRHNGVAKHLPPQRMNVISQLVTMEAMYSSFTWDRLNVMLRHIVSLNTFQLRE